MNRPNILYLHSHDTGRFIGPYHSDFVTPALSRLAGDSMLFRQAFAASPTCSPSRAALTTGQYPHRNGMMGLTHRGFSLNEPGHHLAACLATEGYITAQAGVQHEASDPRTLGYQKILTERKPSNGATGTGDAAVEFVQQRHEAPFFLSVGFFETHQLFPPPAEGDGPWEKSIPEGLPDLPEVREDLAGFQRALTVFDQQVGRILEALAESGRLDDTLVICTTDHGAPFPDMKSSLRDDGVGVFMLLRPPGWNRGALEIQGQVSQLDLFPTVVEYTGMKPRHTLDGVSLMPWIVGDRGPEDASHETLHFESSFHSSYEPLRAVRTRGWKYIRRWEPGPPPLPNVPRGKTKEALLKRGYAEQKRPAEELYDLTADPGETRNLAGEGEFSKIRRELEAYLFAWMEASEDPLAGGGVLEPPETAQLREGSDAK